MEPTNGMSASGTATAVSKLEMPQPDPTVFPTAFSEVAHLLRLGLITYTAKSEMTKFELTLRGLQFLADYEEMTQEQLNDEGFGLSRNDFATLNGFNGPVDLTNIGQVSLLVPTFNEANNIGALLCGLRNRLPGINEVVVMDKSEDETALVARKLGARVMTQSGKGKGSALRQAFQADYSGDIVVCMDADGSNRIEEIPRLVEEIVKGADVAKGSRFLKGGGSTDLTLIRRIGNKLFLSIVNKLWLTHYTDLCYGFIAYRKDALIRLAPLLNAKGFEIETEIFIKAHKAGLKVVEVPSIELRRRHGESKLQGIQDSMRIFRTILQEFLIATRDHLIAST